jgi:hypothetical protein
MLTAAKEQMTVVGSSLQTVGYTSADVAAKLISEHNSYEVTENEKKTSHSFCGSNANKYLSQSTRPVVHGLYWRHFN